MTLYQDLLYHMGSYEKPELPSSCDWIDDEIRFWNVGNSAFEICPLSLIMFLGKMHDRIKELEEQVRVFKGEM